MPGGITRGVGKQEKGDTKLKADAGNRPDYRAETTAELPGKTYNKGK